MSDVQVFRYQSFGIQVETRADGMWNLTALCKPFNARPVDFLKTKEGASFFAYSDVGESDVI